MPYDVDHRHADLRLFLARQRESDRNRYGDARSRSRSGVSGELYERSASDSGKSPSFMAPPAGIAVLKARQNLDALVIALFARFARLNDDLSRRSRDERIHARAPINSMPQAQ